MRESGDRAVHSTFCSERQSRHVRAQQNREHGCRTLDDIDIQVIRVARGIPASPFEAGRRKLKA